MKHVFRVRSVDSHCSGIEDWRACGLICLHGISGIFHWTDWHWKGVSEEKKRNLALGTVMPSFTFWSRLRRRAIVSKFIGVEM